jgi:hypothetical protein
LGNRELLQGDRILLLALEKRLNFTLEDLDITAHAYTHFREFLITDDPAADWGPLSAIWSANASTNATSSPTSSETTTTNSAKTGLMTNMKNENTSKNETYSTTEATTTNEATANQTTTTTTNKATTNDTTTNETTTNETTNASETTQTSETTTYAFHTPTYPKFHARAIPIDFPQYFEYERVKELELWAIKLVTPLYGTNPPTLAYFP